MCRVLVVDGDPSVGTLITRELKQYDVRAVQEVVGARWVIREHKPSLIFMSAQLGCGDRNALLEYASKRAAIIVMTDTKLGDNAEANILEAGAAGVVSKPLSVRKFVALANRLYQLLELDKDITESYARLTASTQRLTAAREKLLQSA